MGVASGAQMRPPRNDAHVKFVPLQTQVYKKDTYPMLSSLLCSSASLSVASSSLPPFPMAKARIFLPLFLLFLLVELDAFPIPWVLGAEGIDCSSRCAYRCSKASRHKMCIRACNTCCQRCHCVPPGTFGNKDVCPCYANMKTHGGRPKCP
ncbi:gibberellin-regulated protein 11-like [Phoenix dactylifera]|uniref:Gibberellin-regulated protein 11-like n=1 Tax=Phoenix dactylifera TaxID=42345 RepID=A0A8B8ZFR1_PHODC|nr:gibberellin-regulated protein 11-like [Phoenix dactylifera]